MFVIPLIVSLLITAAGVTIEVQKANRQAEQVEEIQRAKDKASGKEGPPAPDSQVGPDIQASP